MFFSIHTALAVAGLRVVRSALANGKTAASAILCKRHPRTNLLVFYFNDALDKHCRWPLYIDADEVT